jgi:hypothetical protein
MGHELTIRGLTEKRADLIAELHRRQVDVSDLLKKQRHLDETIEMLGVDADGRKTIRETFRGENAQAVMTVLRTAQRSLMASEIARQVLILRQIDPDNERLLWLMTVRVREILGQQKIKGTVVSHESIGPLLEWRLA